MNSEHVSMVPQLDDAFARGDVPAVPTVTPQKFLPTPDGVVPLGHYTSPPFGAAATP